MLSKCARAPGAPGPKWNQLEGDRLTQADFYDELLFPRDAFRLDPGRGYCNEQAMLSSMNTLHRALRRGSGEEWKIFEEEDGSRIVRLVIPEQPHSKEAPTAIKANPKVPLALKETYLKVESRLKKWETLQGSKECGQEFVVGRGRASHKSIVRARSRLTTQRQNLKKGRQDEPKQSVSLTHLRADWERRPVKTKHEAEQRLRQSGDFKPFSLEELKRMSEDKKRYLEKIKLGEGRRILEKESKGEYTGAKIIEIFDSDGDGDDSDSSVSSCRTRIIRYAKLVDKKKMSDASSTEKSINAEYGVVEDQKRSDDLGVADVDELSKTDVVSAEGTNFTLALPQDGVMTVDNLVYKNPPSKYESIKVDNKSEVEPFKLESKVVLVKPLNIDKEMCASMLNRDPSIRTTLGIFDRSQWYKDLAKTIKHPITRHLLREGYDVKTQKETSDRLSVPKYGPFAIKRDGLKQTEEHMESKVSKLKNNGQGSKDCTSKQTCSKEIYLKQGANGITNGNGSYFTHTKTNEIKSKSPSETEQAGSGFNIPKLSKNRNPIPLRPQFNLSTIQRLYDSPKFLSRRDVRLRSENKFPHDLKQTGSGDAVSKSSKPDFDLRTTVGLNDRSKPSARSDSSSQSKWSYTRRTAPGVESSIVSSAEVNRRKVAREIELENLRIMTRLGDIKNRRTRDKISFRGTRRQQLPLARILNRAVTN